MAGIVDGEGYVGFSSSPTIQVETVTPSLAYIPQELFGGSVTIRERHGASIFRWSVSGNHAILVLAQLMPFLRYKKRQAEIVVNAGKYPVKSAMRAAHATRLKTLRKQRY
tara:strand:- start:4543 stop:4872 length:330 start_codon:yes stop_codon:yes gene_type:complete